MKILVIQLARLGDIFMTWPALRALKRAHPQAEIHLLTRPRFGAAVEGLTAVDRHISLPVSTILAPLVQEDADFDTSLVRLNETVDSLVAENYDTVVNLTFSPVSSYLTHAVSGLHTTVLGYTRYNDGTLCLADEVSSYFYAQVGPERANRVHLADIFASMLNVEYIEQDWMAPVLNDTSFALPDCYMALHVGASEKHKSLSPTAWARTLAYFSRRYQGLPIVLIGAAGELPLAEEIIQGAPNATIINLVGKTSMPELFTVIQDADILVGCDSAPIHMASLTDTPTLNVSVGKVNYWETGPKATLGFIYRIENEEKLVTERLGEVMALLLEGEVASELIPRAPGLVSYAQNDYGTESFQWGLVQALYLGGAYPIADKMEIIQGATQLQDINNFAMEQIALIPEKGLEVAGPLLDSAEEVIQNISRVVPELSPLINWYQAEKIRIGPGSLEEICATALSIHQRLARHVEAYVPHDALIHQEEALDGTL